MFGESMRLAQRRMDIIPAPQAEQRREDMFHRLTLSGQLQGPRIGVPHLLNAPALGRPQGVAERYLQLQFHLAAQQGVVDMGNLPQSLLQMANSLAMGRTSSRLFARRVPVA